MNGVGGRKEWELSSTGMADYVLVLRPMFRDRAPELSAMPLDDVMIEYEVVFLKNTNANGL